MAEGFGKASDVDGGLEGPLELRSLIGERLVWEANFELNGALGGDEM